MGRRQVDEDVELAVEGLEPRAGKGRAGALQIGVGQPAGDALRPSAATSSTVSVRKTCRSRAGAHSPASHLASADSARHHRPVDGMAEQAEGRAQAAQRHARLVDADRPAALQDDGAVLAEVGMAVGHDVAQRDIGRGRGGETGIEGRHAGPTVAARKRPGNCKERQSDEGFVTCSKQHFACTFR